MKPCTQILPKTNTSNQTTFSILPLVLFLGLSEPLRFAGLRLDDVFRLLDGLEALPDVLVSVLSVLEELCELCVIITACSSPSLESSLESPVNGMERI